MIARLPISAVFMYIWNRCSLNLVKISNKTHKMIDFIHLTVNLAATKHLDCEVQSKFCLR